MSANPDMSANYDTERYQAEGAQRRESMDAAIRDIQRRSWPVTRAEFAVRFLGWTVFPYDMRHVPSACVEHTGAALIPPNLSPHVSHIRSLPVLSLLDVLTAATVKFTLQNWQDATMACAQMMDMYARSGRPEPVDYWIAACVVAARLAARRRESAFTIEPDMQARMSLLWSRL